MPDRSSIDPDNGWSWDGWLAPRRHPDPIEATCGCIVLIVAALIVLGALAWLVVALLP